MGPGSARLRNSRDLHRREKDRGRRKSASSRLGHSSSSSNSSRGTGPRSSLGARITSTDSIKFNLSSSSSNNRPHSSNLTGRDLTLIPEGNVSNLNSNSSSPNSNNSDHNSNNPSHNNNNSSKDNSNNSSLNSHNNSRGSPNSKDNSSLNSASPPPLTRGILLRPRLRLLRP